MDICKILFLCGCGVVNKIAIQGLGIVKHVLVCVRKIAIRGFGDSEACISMCT